MIAMSVILASLSMPVSGSMLAAQANASRAEPDACVLVTHADVEKVTGRRARKTPSRLSDVMKTQSYCGYRDARVRVTLNSRASAAEKHVAQELETGGFDKTGHAVAGLGDSAAVHYKPQGRTPEAFLVTYKGTRTLTIAVRMDHGQQSDAARPFAVGLAKIALAKLD
jgi:hypothetical protein